MTTGSDSSEVQIRAGVPKDAAAIALLLFASFSEYKSLYTDEGFAATTPGHDQILKRMSEGPLWVATINDEMVGTVSVVQQDEEIYIRGMAVLPTMRGKRIGELLLEQVENWAGAHCKRLFLSTTPFLTSAIRLYERVGFRRTDCGPHDIFGTPLFTMEKRPGEHKRC